MMSVAVSVLTVACDGAYVAGAALCNERLLPAFVKLSKDDVWGVRKACAESLVAISKAVDAGTRVAVSDDDVLLA